MKEVTNLGIIGQGFVGKSIRNGLYNDYNIYTFDINPKLSGCESIKYIVDNCDVIFICVPTPMEASGNCHTGILEDVIGSIYDISKSKILILKTTIPPRTIDNLEYLYDGLRFIYNPEFLTEANANDDFKNQNRIILGGTDGDALGVVTSIYRKTFPLIPIVWMSYDEAIMVKYITNIFLATKVTLANEFYEICDSLAINYDTVVKAATLDTRLGLSHWKVPGPDGDLGFGGHCFPKDTNAIRFIANKRFIETELIDAVLSKNDRIRKNRDWEKQIGRAVI